MRNIFDKIYFNPKKLEKQIWRWYNA